MGNPKNEVFPNPAVKIKQPINFLDQLNFHPKKLKNSIEIIKPIQVTLTGNNKWVPNLIFGI